MDENTFMNTSVYIKQQHWRGASQFFSPQINTQVTLFKMQTGRLNIREQCAHVFELQQRHVSHV